MKELSEITNKLIGQPMFELLHQVQEMERAGQKILHFEIGDPDFDSPDHAKEELKKAIDSNMTHYTSSMGLHELRNAVADYTFLHWGFKPEIDQILICTANAIIDFVVRCVCNKGEEVMYPDPGFPTYYSVINYNNMVPIGIPLIEENYFRMDPADIKDRISKKTRLIIINSPHNPTGAIISQACMLQTSKIAEENDLYLLSDEVYSRITYGKMHYSPCVTDQCKERTILLHSLSKTYSMSGWRVGYVIGPKNLIQKMGLLLQTILSCLPAFTQIGAMAAMLHEKEFLNERIKILSERRHVLVDGINQLRGISGKSPDGSFYLFMNINRTGMNSEQYCQKLLAEQGVCLLPGNCFGPKGEGYVRLCYASTSIEVIKSALEKMGQFHRKYVK